MKIMKPDFKIIALTLLVMAVYFVIANPMMNDDGFHYEGFTESLAKGTLDFKSFYGFHGLSILSVPIYWLTGSKISIIIASMILYLLSLPLAYAVGKDFYRDKKAGTYFMALILLMPYTYTTMMRGFQEAALLFFVLLIIYVSINKKIWTPISWAVGGLVKPFALVLFPLFIKDFHFSFKSLKLSLNKIIWVVAALAIGGLYLGASYYQTGHLVNNAAINSYQGNFDPGNPPPLAESFVPTIKGFLRVGANFLVHSRKLLASPLVIVLGLWALWANKNFRKRNEIILAIALNILLVGSLTFSFPKYLLPAVVLFALSSVSVIIKYPWLGWLVLIDSLFVFLPIWNYFGKSFWSNVYLYLVPLYLATFLILYAKSNYSNPNS